MILASQNKTKTLMIQLFDPQSPSRLLRPKWYSIAKLARWPWITKSPKRLHTVSDTPDGNIVAIKRKEIADATLLLQSNCQRSITHRLDGVSGLEETWHNSSRFVRGRSSEFFFFFCPAGGEC
jgi:hypothetical protein